MIRMLRCYIVRANSHMASVNIWLAKLEQKWPVFFFFWEIIGRQFYYLGLVCDTLHILHQRRAAAIIFARINVICLRRYNLLETLRYWWVNNAKLVYKLTLNKARLFLLYLHDFEHGRIIFVQLTNRTGDVQYTKKNMYCYSNIVLIKY